MIEFFKRKYTELRRVRFEGTPSSLIHLATIVLVTPVIGVVLLWAYMLFFKIIENFYFSMIDYGLKIVDHLWAVPVITGLLALAKAWVDRNQDNIPDDFQKGENK